MSSSHWQESGNDLGVREALTVSQLNEVARALLEDALGDIRVVGEISNFKAYPSGHWYFSLKDERAAVRSVMFKGANRTCRIKPAEGMKVIVRGRASVYQERGEFQLIVSSLEPAGAGALWAAYEQLKQKLAAEGLFDRPKRPLPLLPRRIGIATSASGAALQDILKVLDNRGAKLSIVIAACRVQGAGAADEIACALDLLGQIADLDAIIVGRGGGSIEDLWAFNEEAVVRAIARMTVPVISAVGHEIDTTLADLVADVRAATPSQAAEMACAAELELRKRLASSSARLVQVCGAACARARTRLARVEGERLRGKLDARLSRSAQHVDHLGARLSRAQRSDVKARRVVLEGLLARLSPVALAAHVKRRREKVEQCTGAGEAALRRLILRRRDTIAARVRQLEALSPLNVLDRGYSVLARADRSIVTSPDDVAAGELVTARLARDRRLDLIVSKESP